jgi:hypothetical protein
MMHRDILGRALSSSLATVEELQLKALSLRGRVPPVRVSRQTLLQANAASRATSEIAQDGKHASISTSIIRSMYPPSTIPLHKLEQCRLSDLRLDVRHIGKFALLRTVTTVFRTIALHVVVEDDYNDSGNLQVFNTDTRIDPQSLFPLGVRIAIKEPYFELASDGGFTIRVDHLSDLMVFQDGNYSSLTSVQSRHWGKMGHVSPRPCRCRCSGNDPQSEPLEHGDLLADGDITAFVDLCELTDSWNKYDLCNHFASVSGLLKTTAIEGKGIGYVATATISTGTILTQERAFAYSDGDCKDKCFPVLINLATKGCLSGNQLQLAAEVAQKLAMSQCARRAFARLWAGSRNALHRYMVVEGQVVIDL